MAKILLGTKKSDQSLVAVDPKNLLMHTIVFGQSGSGKSFFLARLLEEVLLRTKARVMVIDPNGDFETFFAPREKQFWDPSGSLGKTLADLQKKEGEGKIPPLDSLKTFSEKWKEIIFQHLVAGRIGRMPLRDKAFGAPVKIHWKYLPPNIQDFLLDIDPIKRPKIFQGIASCHHFADQNRKIYPSGVSLCDLEDIALRFESKEHASSLTYFPDAMTLNSDDWHAVRMQFRMVRKRFSEIMYLNRLRDDNETQASDVAGYIRRGFIEGNKERPPWQFLSLGLAGAQSDHALLSTYYALQSIWLNAIRAWREERKSALNAVTSSVLPTSELLGEFEQLNEQNNASDDAPTKETGASDVINEETQFAKRRPTFVVIDEAHNFVPEEADTPLQRKVSDLVTTIAAEGRKYGIFLIISTQRPQKIRKGIVAECENLAVLKLQSVLERKYLVDNTTLEAGNDDKVKGLNQGEALLSGRWIGDTSVIAFAPARTFLGGAGITPEAWLLD